MKLAIIGDELDQDLNRVIEAVKTSDFHGIEIRSVWNTQPDQLTRGQLEKIKDSVQHAGLSIAGFDSPCFKTALPTSDQELDKARTSLQHAIEQARLLDAGFVRVFTFYREGEARPEVAANTVKQIVKGLIPDDIGIYFETGMRTNTPTVKSLLAFLNVLGDDRFGIVWDPGNSVFSGYHKSPYPEDYEWGKDMIKHIHIKDPAGQREYVQLGDGDIPWVNLLRRLKDDNYQGYISLETHWRIGRVLDQNQRDNPWFDNFSLGGYEASMECMRILHRYISEVWEDE